MTLPQKEELDEWEQAHADCTPKNCKLYGTVYCQTGCTLRWDWDDDEPEEYDGAEYGN